MNKVAAAAGLLGLTAWALTSSPSADEPDVKRASFAPVAAPAAKPDRPGVLVLGIDGMDPVITRRFMDKGHMPNFAKMIANGGFQSLGTANPPQSPVAWSNFVTGMNPGGHGIYDFVHRDPHSYLPISSATEVLGPDDEPGYLDLFGYSLPLGGGEAGNNRSGTPFWDVLHDAGVETEVYRIPGNFPVTPSEAVTLSGMGTPDLRGGFGVYQWFTDDPPTETGHLKGELNVVTVDDTDLDGVGDTVLTKLTGPDHPLKRSIEGEPPPPPLSVPMTVHVDAQSEAVWIKCGDAETVIAEGEWSDWLEVSFDVVPMGLLPAMTGQLRFYLKEAQPTFKLYASPINFLTAAPVAAITTPDAIAEEIYDAVGHIYTQGMPEETDALKDGTFSDEDYISQVKQVHADGEVLLDWALSRFERGDMTFFYLSDIDLQCHMLWRLKDPKFDDAPQHPAYDPALGTRNSSAIQEFYQGVDRILGHVLETVPEDTLVVVMSDHGFQPYTRELNLNAWLRDNGYLVLNEADDFALERAVDECGWVPADMADDYAEWRAGLPPAPGPRPGYRPPPTPVKTSEFLALHGHDKTLVKTWAADLKSGSNPALRDAVEAGTVARWSDERSRWEHFQSPEAFMNVDWNHTVAFGAGFNALYLNVEGREHQGIVPPGDADALAAEIAEKLEALVDPKLNTEVVKTVYTAEEAYSGTRVPEAPDLVVGYDRLFGCSDDSTLGAVPAEWLRDNVGRWSGNHLMDPKVVPGILISNHPIDGEGYDLTDLTASLLDHFGVAQPAGMIGEPIRFGSR